MDNSKKKIDISQNKVIYGSGFIVNSVIMSTIPLYPGFAIVVVRLSKTTKNRHGQPNMNLWNTLVVRTDNHIYPRNNFATEHADIYAVP